MPHVHALALIGSTVYRTVLNRNRSSFTGCRSCDGHVASQTGMNLGLLDDLFVFAYGIHIIIVFTDIRLILVLPLLLFI